MNIPDPRTTGGLLTPRAHALESVGFDVLEPVRRPARAFVLRLVYWAIIVGEFVALWSRVHEGAQRYIRDWITALMIAGAISTLGVLPWFSWLRKPVEPAIDIDIPIGAIPVLIILQAYILATWILRELPPMSWVLGGIIVAFALTWVGRTIVMTARSKTRKVV